MALWIVLARVFERCALGQELGLRTFSTVKPKVWNYPLFNLSVFCDVFAFVGKAAAQIFEPVKHPWPVGENRREIGIV